MGRTKGSGQAIRCPHHPAAHVVAFGFTPNRTRRRLRCESASGIHTFSVPVVTAGEDVVVWSAPPPCPKHADGRVIRSGTSRAAAGGRVQRYRCFPTHGQPHSFTPVVARRHVHAGSDRCGTCDHALSPHKGSAIGGRYWHYDPPVIAGVLQLVGQGSTYVEASRWARRQTPGASASKDNGLAIGIVETFSHVVWGPISSALIEAEGDHRRRVRAGEARPPSLLAVDDVTFSRRDGNRFHCLVGVDFNENSLSGEREAHIRFVRALATNDTAAWTIALSEIGAPPDYLIADGASAIAAAVPLAFPDAEGDEVTYLPSLWHIRRNLHEAFFHERSRTADRAGGRSRAERDLPHPVAIHLGRLAHREGALASPQAFDDWWTQLENLYRAWGVPADVVATQRAAHYDRIASVAGDLARLTFLPASTGAVEALIRDKVKPFFNNRAHSFGNLERTNRSLNLLVAWNRGDLDDTSQTAQAVIDDLAAHNGRAPAQRTSDDAYYTDGTAVIRYSSLCDPGTVAEIARRRRLG